MNVLMLSIILSLLVIMALAVFYLLIRLKDVMDSLKRLGEILPLSDEMRKQASNTIESLNERIGSLNQKASQIGDVIKEVADLRNLFIIPKAAGMAGERLLEKTLHDVLMSDMYIPQYRLSSGIVDFVIRFRECVVPIDSKLSLEDYSRMISATDDNNRRSHWKLFVQAVKKRIDETAKYILPGEKTTDFAFMYIPSESVYYEAFVKPKQFNEENTLIDYAIRKRVYPVSPQTIYPYLMTILHGMKALRIEENAKEILNRVAGLRNDFDRFRGIYNIIVGHIENAQSKHHNDAIAAMARLDQHISSLEHRDARSGG